MAVQYILLISNNEMGFTINTLHAAITKAGIEVKKIAIDNVNLSDYINSAFGVLIADAYENTLQLNTIKKKCYEQNKKVILYGNVTEIDAMKRIFIDSIIYKEILRPVEMIDAISVIKKLKLKVENQDVMKKVLVVDDNGVLLRTIMGWLEGKYIVSLANSAANARTAIEKSTPDLILLDYEMPECSGAEFMMQLSKDENTNNTPIIFLTSRCDEKTVKEVMLLKPKGYILKTTPQEQLLKKLEDFFDSLLVE